MFCLEEDFPMSFPKFNIGDEVKWKTCGIKKYDSPEFIGWRKITKLVHGSGRILYRLEGLKRLYTTKNIDNPSITLERKLLRSAKAYGPF